MDGLIELFCRIGLDEKKAGETIKNKKLCANLEECIREAGVMDGVERSVGSLLYSLASTIPSAVLMRNHRPFIAKKIVSRDIRTEDQLQAAFHYLSDKDASMINEVVFNEECGIGVIVGRDIVEAEVKAVLEEHKTGLLKDRYIYPLSSLMKSLKGKATLKWADKKMVKEVLDEQLLPLLGPKESEEELKRMKREALRASAAATNEETTIRQFVGQVAQLHKPGENPQISEEIRQEHLRATGGKVITRFPPEPNGFLHIGHAKAINLNFKYAAAHGGICNLRFDDTNPEAEEERYFEAIKSNVEWLGFKPDKITASSDYFQQLYEYALILIKKGKAYVCHMSQEEINLSRGGSDGKGPRYNSPWRDRSIEENLVEFERMKRGEYEEGKAILRLKQDMQSGNSFMWDLVAYRVIKSSPHVRTGSEWCIYPMYDFTHCLCDSIENITHSMCTTEFINAREAYYWVCDNVGVYKPVQWEYGRLNITNTVLSKRKLTKLVEAGIIRSWDDPRVYTLAALRRRGFPPQAINNFVEELGVTTAYSVVDVKKLDNCVRSELNKSCLRRMAILDPIPLRITNLNSSDENCELLNMPNDPRDPSKGESFLPLTPNLFIDRSDFSLDSVNDPNYFRLTPAQPVGLYRIGVFTCTRWECDENGKVTLVEGTIDRSSESSESAADVKKPKTFITWLPNSPEYNSPLKAEIRLYSPLFKSRNPDSVSDGFLNDINTDSLTIIPEALVDPRLADAKVEETFQFQRVGYFCVDPDSTDRKLVFNLTVSIKEDPTKDK